ncbi:MAG: zinc ribbon domain-containing protein [Clostridia bacterium]|nr:zinc ribbon domain-containing protein [Clostridia bacterium]
MNERILPASDAQPNGDTPPAPRAYCPYCGAKTAPDHNFCQSCGKRLP